MRISDWSSDVCSSDLILAGAVGQILLVETVADRLARRRNGFARHLYAVGPHMGDEAVLIELLGEAHRMAGGEMQLARGFLLKRGGGEGRLRIARLRLGFDRGDTEPARLHIGPGGMGGRFVVQVELVEFLALPLGKPRIERLSARLHGGGDGPVFLRAEGLDLALAVNDQTPRDTRPADRRFRAGPLAPTTRRQVAPSQMIQERVGRHAGNTSTLKPA